jgi:hypothetical protein
LKAFGMLCSPKKFECQVISYGQYPYLWSTVVEVLILGCFVMLSLFFKMSLIGLIILESLGKNCDKNIMQPIKDLIPRAVIGMGRLVIDCTLEPRGVMVGIPFLLDKSKPIYLTECLNACTLLSVSNKPYSFSLCKKNVNTLM